MGYAGVTSVHVSTTGAVGPKAQSNAAQGLGVINGYVTLMGWSLSETAGTTNEVVTITDSGASGGGKVTPAINIPKGTTDTKWFGPEGIRVPIQLYITASGGTLDGVLWVR